jgi:hypothetical protein
MKLLVRQRSRLLFLAEGEVWTADPTKALVFSDGMRAMSYCAVRNLRDVSLVRKSDPSNLAIIPRRTREEPLTPAR